MPDSVPTVLILGHSFVRRMQDDLSNRFHPRTDLNFNLSDATVCFHEVGGRTVRKLRTYDLYVVRRLKPDVIILELGTNDLTNLSPEVVGSEIEELVSLLLETFSVRVICVCHVIPRGISFAGCDRFLQRISSLKQYLSVVLAFPQVFCWTHYSFSNPSKPFYLADGVHLNQVGQYLLYRSYRGAILKALAML